MMKDELMRMKDKLMRMMTELIMPKMTDEVMAASDEWMKRLNVTVSDKSDMLVGAVVSLAVAADEVVMSVTLLSDEWMRKKLMTSACTVTSGATRELDAVVGVSDTTLTQGQRLQNDRLREVEWGYVVEKASKREATSNCLDHGGDGDVLSVTLVALEGRKKFRNSAEILMLMTKPKVFCTYAVGYGCLISGYSRNARWKAISGSFRRASSPRVRCSEGQAQRWAAELGVWAGVARDSTRVM
ncbi:hypothetical protein PR003_g25477 [Phytophthora rubi]|nr:hypothetical protein PR002_g26749 [Phytophthora rubi]KAE9289729.1 hypothetical protein PR003_g25477 [Phytophthora rubi]